MVSSYDGHNIPARQNRYFLDRNKKQAAIAAGLFPKVKKEESVNVAPHNFRNVLS